MELSAEVRHVSEAQALPLLNKIQIREDCKEWDGNTSKCTYNDLEEPILARSQMLMQ